MELINLVWLAGFRCFILLCYRVGLIPKKEDL